MAHRWPAFNGPLRNVLPIDQKKIGLTPNLGAYVRAPGVGRIRAMGLRVACVLRVGRPTGELATREAGARAGARVIYICIY